MFHVAEHFESGREYEHMRPDFFVIKYMRAQGLINEDDFHSVMEYTERPPIDCLVTAEFKTPETKDRERKDKTNIQVYDQGKEDRHRRRNAGKRQPKARYS